MSRLQQYAKIWWISCTRLRTTPFFCLEWIFRAHTLLFSLFLPFSGRHVDTENAYIHICNWLKKIVYKPNQIFTNKNFECLISCLVCSSPLHLVQDFGSRLFEEERKELKKKNNNTTPHNKYEETTLMSSRFKSLYNKNN